MAKPAFDASLSPETVARYSAELTDLLERIDTAKEELREESKERRAEIRSMEKGAYRLRKLLRSPFWTAVLELVERAVLAGGTRRAA